MKRTNSNSLSKKNKSEKKERTGVEGRTGEWRRVGREGREEEKERQFLDDMLIRTLLMAINQSPTKLGLGKTTNKIKNELICVTEKYGMQLNLDRDGAGYSVDVPVQAGKPLVLPASALYSAYFTTPI